MISGQGLGLMQWFRNGDASVSVGQLCSCGVVVEVAALNDVAFRHDQNSPLGKVRPLGMRWLVV
jgi:hypothetical protein